MLGMGLGSKLLHTNRFCRSYKSLSFVLGNFGRSLTSFTIRTAIILIDPVPDESWAGHILNHPRRGFAVINGSIRYYGSILRIIIISCSCQQGFLLFSPTAVWYPVPSTFPPGVVRPITKFFNSCGIQMTGLRQATGITNID